MNLSLVRSHFFCALLGLLACSVAAAQTVTINLVASRLYDNSGTTLPNGALVLLIADTSHNGFGSLMAGSSVSLGSLLNGDDQVLGATTILNDDTGTAFDSFPSITVATSPYTNLTAGDPLAIVWFSSLNGDSTTLTAGDSYGFFSSASLTDDGDPWVVPAPGTPLVSLEFKTGLGDGSHAEEEAFATSTVSPVPEPATSAAIVGSLILGLAFLRRRQAR